MTTVVGAKQYLCCRKFPYKHLHTGRSGSTKTVNCLVIISHCEYIFMSFRQQPYNTILPIVNILKFIDQNIEKRFCQYSLCGVLFCNSSSHSFSISSKSTPRTFCPCRLIFPIYLRKANFPFLRDFFQCFFLFSGIFVIRDRIQKLLAISALHSLFFFKMG